jgi:hypothetical protein
MACWYAACASVCCARLVSRSPSWTSATPLLLWICGVVGGALEGDIEGGDGLLVRGLRLGVLRQGRQQVPECLERDTLVIVDLRVVEGALERGIVGSDRLGKLAQGCRMTG